MTHIKECPYLSSHQDLVFPDMLPIDYLYAVKLYDDNLGSTWTIKCSVCNCRGPEVFVDKKNSDNGEKSAWQAWNNR